VSPVFSFLSRTFKELNARHGEEISFRGQNTRAVLQSVAPSFDLVQGGYSESGSFNCQILKETVSTPPQSGDAVIYRGRSYSVSKEIREDKSGTAYLITITPRGGG
jgi:hypothetical protein